MVDIASAIYPNLPSAGAPAAPDPPPAGPREGGERSLAETIYGSAPGDGLEKTREGIAAGIARPAGEPPSPPSERAQPSDWLAEALKEGREPEASEPAGPTGPGHLVEQFHELARDAGLSADRSAAMLKLHQDALTETSARYWSQQGAAWEKQSRAQFGSQLDSMVNTVKPLLNDPRLTPPAFLALLQQYQIGSHPVLIDMLHRWSREMRRR